MLGLLPSPCQPASKPFHDDLLLIWVTVGSALMAVFTPPPLGTEAGSRGGFVEAGGLGTEGEERWQRWAPLGSVYSGSHQVILDRIKNVLWFSLSRSAWCFGKEALDIQVVEKREKHKQERLA